MQVVNGSEEEVLSMLKGFGLCEYEARMYFTLLTIGEAKVTAITRKASVPQSRAYNVLESLRAKRFVELSRTDRPKMYRARALEEITHIAIKARQKEIQKMEENQSNLYHVLQSVAPLHRKYYRLRLFSPSYKRR